MNSGFLGIVFGIVVLVAAVSFLLKCWMFLFEVPELIRRLPDEIADKVVEKLRKEENRRQSERDDGNDGTGRP